MRCPPGTRKTVPQAPRETAGLGEGRRGWFHRAHLRRLRDAADVGSPNNLPAHWQLCPDADWTISPPPQEGFIGLKIYSPAHYTQNLSGGGT